MARPAMVGGLLGGGAACSTSAGTSTSTPLLLHAAPSRAPQRPRALLALRGASLERLTCRWTRQAEGKHLL